MKKQLIALVALAALSGCSTVNTTMTQWSNELANASWTKKDYWLGSSSKAEVNAAVEPAAGKPAVAKLETSLAPLAPVKTPEVKGERMVRISGLSAQIAKDSAFKAAKDTCAKLEEDTQLQASVVSDKAGEAGGSYFHDVEFDCV